MKYYSLQLDTNKEVIGKYPQLYDFTIDFNSAGGDKFEKLESWKEEIDLPSFKHFKLETQSKLSDFLTSRFIIDIRGLIVSEKIGTLFNQFSIYNYNRRKALIHSGSKQYNYEFIWYLDGDSNIDFKKSEFVKLEKFTDNPIEELIVIENIDDFKFKNMKAIRQNHKLAPKKIALIEPTDLFSPFISTGRLLCSNALKIELESANATGVLFTEIPFEVIGS